MSSSLVPEKPLLVYPSLAATLGLEESLLLCTLADEIRHAEGAESRGFHWYQLAVDHIASILPFWQTHDLQRIATSLREKGVIILSPAPIARGGTLKFAFNEKVQQQMARQMSPQVAEPPPQPRAPRVEGGFLSKTYIAPNWRPDEHTLNQLAQHAIPRSFAFEQVPEFITYWRDRREQHHSWGSKFLQHTLYKWRDFETERHLRDQETPMHAGWQPSADALDILIDRAGIRREFVEDAIPEFILYWQERGELHRTWNTKFVQHVRMQWARFTALIEHNSEPVPIPANWSPSADVFDVLNLANIDGDFARGLILEFVLYWRDNGRAQLSWNTKFLQHVKRMWSQRLASENHVRQTRDIQLEEELTDRSWAN